MGKRRTNTTQIVVQVASFVFGVAFLVAIASGADDSTALTRASIVAISTAALTPFFAVPVRDALSRSQPENEEEAP